MTNRNHLNEDELSKQLIDPQSLSTGARDHLHQCQQCQKQNDWLLDGIKHAEKTLTAQQNSQDQARRTFWTTTVSKSEKWRTNTGRMLVGATVCALLSFFFLPLTSWSPENTFPLAEQNVASAETTSLLLFAAALAPDTEIMEPELISFIQPEEYESTNEQFSDFILFISPKSQDQS